MRHDHPVNNVLSVGHGTLSWGAFERRLHEAGVDALVDIRIGPGSRRNPHFNRTELEQALPAAGISYRWEQRLGGFRKLPADSPDQALRNESFRAYAAYMRTPEFEAGLNELLSESASGTTAIMCSESVWWRCHRRLVADHLLLIEGFRVQHLMPDGRLRTHAATPGVRVRERQLLYDDADEARRQEQAP